MSFAGKKSVRFFAAIFTLLILLALSGCSFAAEGDVLVPLSLEEGSAVTPLGTGFYRGKDLWISEDSALAAGIPLVKGPNGKGFYIQVRDPALVFEIPELERLAGSVLNLYFPSLVENGISYFNVSGMERVTGLVVRDRGAAAALRRMTRGEPLPARAPKPSPEIYGRIKGVWAHITKENPDLSAEPKIEQLDVLMPTWFNLIDGHGGMANRGSVPYVEEAHRRGYRVWGLVSNGFSKMLSTQLFKNARAMEIFIARLLAYAKLYNLDGINVDFEGLDPNDRAAFVRFISLLAPRLREQGLKSSVDVFIPANSGSSRSHDRAALSRHVDYVMLMAYDQHWRTSQIAGSVASIKWVESAVKNTLSEGVPAEKLVLGVPFYMRR